MESAVLVLGAAGFVGRKVTAALATSGVPVIALTRGAIPSAHQAGVEWVSRNVRSVADLADLVARSRAVVHLATTSSPGSSAGRPLEEVSENLTLTAILLESLQQSPEVELLFMSSGGSLYADTGGPPSTETSPVSPRSYHGAAKLASEHLIAAWSAQYAGRATILRPSNVYGPGQPERRGFGIVPAALGRVLRREPLSIWGDGSARRDYIFVDDLVELCQRVLERPMAAGPCVYNACSNESISIRELVAAIEMVTGHCIDVRFEAARQVDASCIAMDSSLAARTFGWRAKTPLLEGLEATWRSFVQSAAGPSEAP